MAQVSVDEILQMIKKGFVFGDKNQVLAADGNNSSTARYINMLSVGAFVATDAQLTDAKTRFVNQATIFGQWNRGSYGLDTAGLGNPVPSNTIPGVPAQTNSWVYDSGTGTINSTLNSSSYITFVSPEKLGTYTHDLTLGATGGDNDYITTVIAYVEDESDMVINNAYGLDPATYPGINTTDAFIPNQHTLSLVRGRTNQNDFPFHNQTIRYAIVYDLCKLTEQVLVSGESLSGMVNMTADFGAGAECDVRVIRDGDIIKTYTTNWSDGSGGKGTLSHELVFDLSSNSITNKFRGSASYGYGALSQNSAYFKNISINPNRNRIYDLRDGTVWAANSAGVYSISSGSSLYDDFGVNRFFYNPTTLEAYYVNPDKTWELIGGGGRFGIEDNTSDVDRTVEFSEFGITFNSSSPLSTFTSNNTENGSGINSTSNNGIAAQFHSVNNSGVYARSDNYYGADLQAFGGSNAIVPSVLVSGLSSGGAGGDGMGTSIDLNVSTSTQPDIAARIIAQWIDATYATRTSQISFLIFKNGVGYNVTFPTASSDRVIPYSVNGNLADSTGNITISTGGGGTATTLSDNLTTTTTGTALDAHQGSVIKGFLDSKVPLTRTITINGVALDLSADRSWTIAASGGSVTSVALQMDNVIFNTAVTNSPVTGSGTLTPTLKTQAINTFLAAPSSGSSAAPTFRGITNADIAGTTGLLTALNTTDKTAIVAAINEVLAKVTANYVTINQRINSAASNFNQTII